MKVGIVGFGKMGMLHGALINSLEGVEISAIADRSKLIIKGIQSLFPKNIKCYSSFEEMFATDNIDVAIITTPTFLHLNIMKTAISKNVAFFVEKPLCINYSEALELENLLKSSNIISTVGFHMRYMPTFLKGREIINSGEIGKIFKAEGEFYVSDIFEQQEGWRFNPKLSGGGVLLDFGVHLVDLLNWYFGKVSAVVCTKRNIFSKEVEDEVEGKIFYETGIIADFKSSWSVSGYRLPYIKLNIIGEDGVLIIDDHNLILKLNQKPEQKINISSLYSGYYLDIGGNYYSIQMKKFVQAIKLKDKRLVTSIEDSIYTQKIIELLYESAKINKKINNEI